MSTHQTGEREYVAEAAPRWTYSVYRAALRLDGKTVALLTPDGRNAFGSEQIQPLLDLFNRHPETADHLGVLLRDSSRNYRGAWQPITDKQAHDATLEVFRKVAERDN